MSFPAGTPTVTLVGKIPSAVAGSAYAGKLVARPSAYLIDSSRHAVYPGGGSVDFASDGSFSVVLLPCDASGIQPTGWRWFLDLQPTGAGAKRIQFYANITGTGTVYFDTLTPVPAPGGGAGSGGVGPAGPTGPAGPAGPTGPAGAKGDTGDTGPAGAVGATGPTGPAGADGADGDPGTPGATGATGPAGPQGDPGPAGAAGAAGATGATGPQGAMGASGTVVTVAQANITDGAVTDLPAPTPWVIVQSSVGTSLQCSIPAAVGDRIDVDLAMMYNGGHYLDVALLTSAGAISVYGSSNTSSPLTEGAPWLYPSVSFSKVMSELFVVQAGHIDGSGNITIALVHSGTSTGRVYANTQYPWCMRLWNFGSVNGSAAGSWLPRPSEQGLITWTGDPNDAGHVTAQSSAGVAGRITLVKIPIREQVTISNIWLGLSGIDAGASLSTCYLGIYDAAGTLKGTTADISSSLMTGATAKALPLVTPFVAAPGNYFIAMLLGGTWTTNSLTFKATGAGISVNANLVAPNLRFSTILTGQTSLPSSLTLSGQGTSTINTGWASQWYGIS